LLKESARDLSSLLEAIPYSSISMVAAGFDRGAVRHRLDGFGYMVPREEGLKSICTFWNSSLFEDRAPAGKVLITSYLQGLPDDTRGDSSDDAIAETALAEMEKILGATGKPIERQVSRHRQALPQYNLGHAERVVAIRTALDALPNLQLAGNYLEGRSIGECADMGLRAAESIRSHFRQ
jgi:protoporphyrinogen/coproporphyrinogen III oxidase